MSKKNYIMSLLVGLITLANCQAGQNCNNLIPISGNQAQINLKELGTIIHKGFQSSKSFCSKHPLTASAMLGAGVCVSLLPYGILLFTPLKFSSEIDQTKPHPFLSFRLTTRNKKDNQWNKETIFQVDLKGASLYRRLWHWKKLLENQQPTETQKNQK